jgi:hypothetical protein
VIGFRPTDEVAALVAKLEASPHTRRSWVFNRAMAIGLPAILKEIGA